MTSFEYRIENIEPPKNPEVLLADLGAKGWELCAVLDQGRGWLFFFKRRITH